MLLKKPRITVTPISIEPDDEDPMASVSIRVRNEEGDDFVVSPSDVVDNINEINSRRSSRRDSTPASSIRRSRPSSAYFNENGEPIEGITRKKKTCKEDEKKKPKKRRLLRLHISLLNSLSKWIDRNIHERTASRSTQNFVMMVQCCE
uniref:Uncharacterized protein n=2 Tax=Caenorhabditis tropicalis TaxID=1561998 RepID=A0A1I7V156_9PELO